ncbi:MAG: CBS domain-containing protein [Deltaproteobacteria bacterium]|nr:CBS domain-containing protein [Deltaproteobacteria bacterium]
MFVGRRMTRNLITVTKDASVLKIMSLLEKHNIDQVPVVEGKKLLGIVSDWDIRNNAPSQATSLEIHELNYLLSEMTAGQIMTKAKDLFTVSPGTPIEEATRLINEKRVNSLPVVLGEEIVGIITTCDLLNVLLEFMGMGMPSSRVELTMAGDMRDLTRVAEIVNARGYSIVSLVSVVNRDGSRTVVIRVNAGDMDELVADFKKEGFQVTTDYAGS